MAQLGQNRQQVYVKVSLALPALSQSDSLVPLLHQISEDKTSPPQMQHWESNDTIATVTSYYRPSVRHQSFVVWTVYIVFTWAFKSRRSQYALVSYIKHCCIWAAFLHKVRFLQLYSIYSTCIHQELHDCADYIPMHSAVPGPYADIGMGGGVSCSQ